MKTAIEKALDHVETEIQSVLHGYSELEPDEVMIADTTLHTLTGIKAELITLKGQAESENRVRYLEGVIDGMKDRTKLD